MARKVRVGGAQLGPIARDESRARVVARLIDLLRQADAAGCDLVVYPELALTSFFPRWYMDDQQEVDRFFERAMPGPETRALFDEAARRGIGFYLGYAELTDDDPPRHFNTAVLVGKDGRIKGKYRKIHLPGTVEPVPDYQWQHLEKRYFDVGDLGFGAWREFGGIVGMCICNDRRWAEVYRVLALQGVELTVLGYNTSTTMPSVPAYSHLGLFHNQLSLQAGAYQNAMWVVGVAKAGWEEGIELMAGTSIVSPAGEVVAETETSDDELIVYDCDLDMCKNTRDTLLNFEKNRIVDAYKLITEQVGIVPPKE